FPLLDHVGIGLFDENSDPSERLAAPIPQLLDSCIYQLRGRSLSLGFRRAALTRLHAGSGFLHGRVCFLTGVVARPSTALSPIPVASCFQPWLPCGRNDHIGSHLASWGRIDRAQARSGQNQAQAAGISLRAWAVSSIGAGRQ